MDEATVFVVESSANVSYRMIMTFTPFTGIEGLSFPLYLKVEAKFVIILLLMLNLYFGIKYKTVIVMYLRSLDSNGPINNLVWFQQLNGICLGTVILIKMIAIISPIPLSRILGNRFCEWTGLPGLLQLIRSNEYPSKHELNYFEQNQLENYSEFHGFGQA